MDYPTPIELPWPPMLCPTLLRDLQVGICTRIDYEGGIVIKIKPCFQPCLYRWVNW